MLKAKKKINKKEMKEDALITTYSKLLVFYEEKKNIIIYAVIGIVVAGGLLAWYFNNRSQNTQKAATAIGAIYSYYDAGMNDPAQMNIAIEGMKERGIMGLKEIVDQYGNSSAGEIARLYLGNAYFMTGKIEEAEKLFGSFSSSDPLLQSEALSGEAACYESKKSYEEAASSYEKAAAMQTVNAAEYLQSSARCYGLKGEKEKALALCKRIKKEFPKSIQARDIDKYISQYSS